MLLPHRAPRVDLRDVRLTTSRRHDSAADHLHYVKRAKYEKHFSDQRVILTSVFLKMTEVLSVIRMRTI
jgi:hypothetical protein